MANAANGRRGTRRAWSESYAIARDINHNVKRLHESVAERRSVLCAAILDRETVTIAAAVIKISVERRRLNRYIGLAGRQVRYRQRDERQFRIDLSIRHVADDAVLIRERVVPEQRLERSRVT